MIPQEVARFIPYIIPILLIQLVLMLAALWDLVRRERTKGPKWAWAAVIVFINIIGPVVYFMLGREE